MTVGLYQPGTTPVHRLPAVAKVGAVFVAGTLAFLTGDLRALAAGAACVAGLYALARIRRDVAWAQLRPVLPVVVVLCAVQWFLAGGAAAATVGLRLVTLVMLAALVALTTRVSDMVRAIETVLSPLRRFGVATDRIGLAISMTLRFIPLLAAVVGEVRDAQRARGVDGSMLALAVPVVVRTLNLADQVAEAIDARSCGAT